MKHQPMGQDQITAPGTTYPTLCDKCVGSITSPANHDITEDTGDGSIDLGCVPLSPSFPSPEARRETGEMRVGFGGKVASDSPGQ